MRYYFFIITIALFAFLPYRAFAIESCIEYGYGATYNYLSGRCECRDGYYATTDYFGNPKCESMQSYCTDNYGFNSRYNSLTDSCECNARYEMSRTYGGYECKSCTSKYGYHSSWSYSSDSCECDDGYTLKDGECVEKELNVYMFLVTDEHSDYDAVVYSTYNDQYYGLDLGIGCGLSLWRYVEKNVVIGLGTNERLDQYGDRLVLQDHDMTCSIMGFDELDEDEVFSAEEEEEAYYYYGNSNTQPSCPANSFSYEGECYCNDGYIARDSGCVTYEQSCQMDYGQNSTGDAEYCYCKDGYEMKDNNCVEIVNEPETIVEEVEPVIEYVEPEPIKNEVEPDEVFVEKNNKQVIEEAEKDDTQDEDINRDGPFIENSSLNMSIPESQEEKPRETFWDKIKNFFKSFFGKAE